MLEKLCVSNFRSHEKSEIDLHKGLNVFLGEVGAGKTSILEALSFALFGKISSNSTQLELIKRGSKQAKIVLVFNIDSEEYKVERYIFPKKTQKAKLWLYKNSSWKLAVEGSNAVSKSIEEILGVDSSTFLAAIYASQGEIKKMLQTQPGKRREQFDKLLGIDVYEKLWETMGQSKSLVLKELIEVQKKASGFEILKNQKKSIRIEIKERKQELESLQRSFKKVKKKLLSKEKQLEILEELKINVEKDQIKKEEIKKQIKKVEERIASLKDQIFKIKKAAQIYKNNQEYLEKEEGIRKERERVDKALQKKCSTQRLLKIEKNFLAEKNQKIIELEKQLERLPILKEELKINENLKAKYSELKIQKKEKQNQLDKVNEEYFKNFQKNENETQKINRINELGECPTCLQKVPEDHKARIKKETILNQLKIKEQIEKWEKTKKEIKDEIFNLNQQIDDSEDAIKKFERVFVEINVIEKSRNELDKIREDVVSLQNRIYSLNWELSGINETNEDLEKIEAEYEEVAEKAKLAREAQLKLASKQELEKLIFSEENNLNILHENYKNSQNRYQELSKQYSDSNYSILKEKVDVLKEKETRASEGINRLVESLKKDENKLEEIKKIINEKSEAKKKAITLETENRILEIVRNGLRNILQPAVRKNSVMLVSDEFQKFYQALSNDNIDYAAIDEDGNIEVIRNGEPSPINTLSGGETTCAALALRLSICSSLTRNQLLLLDEPTIHLDEVYRAKLRDFLRTHDFDQLIVVTHDNTFDSLPAQIFNIEKKNGNSTVNSLKMGGFD